MAGYDQHKLKLSFNIQDGLVPQCIIALGYLDEAEKLEEPFKTREVTPRSRKSVESLLV